MLPIVFDISSETMSRFSSMSRNEGTIFRVGLTAQPSQSCVAPSSRIFLTIAKLVRVTDRYFGPIWYTQTQFNPRVASVDVHFGKRRREKRAAIVRKEPAVPIVPTAEFSKTGFDITELWLRQLQCYIVIVGIQDRVAVDRKQAVLAQRPLKVQVLDAAVSGIGREPVLLFELSVVAVHNGAANTELDPVFVLLGLSSVVVVTALPSVVSPARSALAAKVPAQTSTRNLRGEFS